VILVNLNVEDEQFHDFVLVMLVREEILGDTEFDELVEVGELK
jgi:hypothetical protein